MIKKRRRKRLIIRLVSLIIIIAMIVTLILSVVSCNNKKKTDIPDTEAVSTDGEDTDDINKVSLIAVGDIIAHDTVLNISEKENGYDFSPLFAKLKDDIQTTDLAICNVETPLGGGPFSGYPVFNTPDEMGDAVVDAGFDVALQASNHSMDAGADGLEHAINYWSSKKEKILMSGLNGSAAEKENIPLITKKGITFAVLNYTYGLNGYELPDDKDYLLTLLNSENEDFIREQIKKASSLADFVIVCPHWGEENAVGEPNEEQRSWARIFTEAGADLIIGTHPHVIEKMEYINAENGNSALCYYSLGNFVSNQQYTDQVLGAMALLDIVKDSRGVHIDPDSVSVIPLVTHNDKTKEPAVIQTYYLADYTEALAAVHDTKLSFEEDFSPDVLKRKSENVFGSYQKERIN